MATVIAENMVSVDTGPLNQMVQALVARLDQTDARLEVADARLAAAEERCSQLESAAGAGQPDLNDRFETLERDLLERQQRTDARNAIDDSRCRASADSAVLSVAAGIRTLHSLALS